MIYFKNFIFIFSLLVIQAIPHVISLYSIPYVESDAQAKHRSTRQCLVTTAWYPAFQYAFPCPGSYMSAAINPSSLCFLSPNSMCPARRRRLDIVSKATSGDGSKDDVKDMRIARGLDPSTDLPSSPADTSAAPPGSGVTREYLHQQTLREARDFLKANLPQELAQHIPGAPLAYEHNQKQGIPMINLNLK